jgi:speckle-type POZ protein
MSLLQASAMEHGRTQGAAAEDRRLLRHRTAALESSEYIKSKWIVDGHEWEVRFYPTYTYDDYCGNCSQIINGVALKLSLLSEPHRGTRPCLVLKNFAICTSNDPTSYLDPSAEESATSYVFSSTGNIMLM